MTKNITVTVGIYDVIKDTIRRKKVSKKVEERLTEELKNASQVRRKELPENTVTVNRKVTILDHNSKEEKEYIFVSTTKAKPRKNKYSIISDIALATVGRSVGDVIEWPFDDGDKTIEIVKVEPFELN